VTPRAVVKLLEMLQRISGVAARTRLRAADATYVWVASSRGFRS